MMPTAKKQPFWYSDFRIHFSLLAVIALASFFWLSSRYPQLDEKALMGADTPISGLSFDILLQIAPNSDVWWEFVANVANWIYTNLKGMTFGVLFGAAALTLLAVIKKRSFENGFANASLGAVIGAPLGVCVNCAAPIALGLHMGRMRLETTLSAMIASPTLNVIVVTMSFALMPFHIAAIKLILALGLVLIVVPVLCRYVLRAETDATRIDAPLTVSKMALASEPRGLTNWIARVLAPAAPTSDIVGVLPSLQWFIRTYSRNFFFIFIITVPLMLLAAALGAVVATIVSDHELVLLFPRSGIVLTLFAMVVTALVASFVPAPIALDVILTAILINIGMKHSYAAVALIGLGSFSVYAFIVLWRSISLRTAVSVWLCVIGMSVIAGVMVHLLTPTMQKYHLGQQKLALNAVDQINWPIPEKLPKGTSLSELKPMLAKHQTSQHEVPAKIQSSARSEIAIKKLSVAAPRSIAESPPTGTIFSRIMGTDLGLMEKGTLSPIRQFGYHMMGQGLAAGDVHNDGWTDIITPRPNHALGISLYANVGGKFVLQSLDLGPVDELEVYNVALADVDGDEQLDLVVSTIMGGDFLYFNEGGTFSKANFEELNGSRNSVMTAIGFSDLDQDGDLDIVTGNWGPRGVAEGWKIKPNHTKNQIFRNLGNRKLQAEFFPGKPQQTLTLLADDFDGDGRPDLLRGDDAARTDKVIFFDGEANVLPTPLEKQPFPYYLGSSMSYDSGDWDNDLVPDYYGGQIAWGAAGQRAEFHSRGKNLHRICSQYGQDLGWNPAEVQMCAADLLSMDAIRGTRSGKRMDSCDLPNTLDHRALCAASGIISRLERKDRNLAGDQKRFAICHRALTHVPQMQRLCNSLLEPAQPDLTKEELETNYRGGSRNGNIMMTRRVGGEFRDVAKDTGVQSPGWSWNSKFKDLDQDGNQDLLVMTGVWLNVGTSTTNVFYHNNGSGFSDETKEFGFSDLAPSYSYVTLDFDRDGDLDVVRDNSALRMIVHRNDKPAGEGIWISLRDRKGNSMGVGARVSICVDGEQELQPGKCQMRTIKASGGYMSSDPIVAHFGLGSAQNVSLIQIKWPDGEISKIKPNALSHGEVIVSRD